MLREHPAVADVYVYGVSERVLRRRGGGGDSLRSSGASIDAAEVLRFCATAAGEVQGAAPASGSCDSFPMTASGKIQKFKLREAHEAEIAATAAAGSSPPRGDDMMRA